jgi:hypothetical protein
MDSGFQLEWTLAAEAFEVQQEEPMSKHDTPTKRKRRPKSDKRVDYTARTMAAIKQHSEAAKLIESDRI